MKSSLAPARSLLALTLFAFAGFGAMAERPTTSRAARHHVLVISVDGMGASFYAAPRPSLRIPNITRLKAAGSFAEGVEGVYPSVTYPSHTTLVTGRVPAEHGVYSNLSSRQAGNNSNHWFWFAKAIKVPTLWDKARRAGLTTAAISWPVTVGADIDWNIPEIWDPDKGPVVDPIYLARYMNPLLTLELAAAAAAAAVGPPKAGSDDDVNRTRAAVYVITKHKPDLCLIHLAMLDEAEHGHGPRSDQAARTLERIDTRIGEILAAVKEAGLENSTDVFIVSDHGFLPVEREIRPNALLVNAGLLTANGRGEITGGKVTTVANGGSFFVYWPDDQDLRREVETALRPLVDRALLWAVFDRGALADLGADPAAKMALEAAAGGYLDSGAGELVSALKSTRGSHGYLPFRKGLEASFIASGPGIKTGVNLHRIRMTAIGPTLLKDLGINDPRFGVERALNDIFK